jgi:hypothetical protein
MSAVVILAIIVASGEGQSPATSAMVAASEEALGAGVSVQVHEAMSPSDQEVSRIEAATSPRAIAEVLWSDAAHEHAHLRVHVARTDRWVDRTIDFVVADSLSERGRTLGFAIASMLPEADPALQVPDVPVIAATAPLAAPPSQPVLRRSIGLAFVGSDGVAGPTTGIGGAADLAFAPTESTAVRLSFELWRGSISTLAATDLTGHVGLGGTWWPLTPTAARSWGLGLGADALVVYQGVSHVHGTGSTEWKSKVSPGADFMIDGRWRVARNVEILAMAGPEVVFGTVDVIVVSSTATREVTLPVLRAVVEAGLRFRF